MRRLAEGRLHMSKWALAALAIHAATLFKEIAPGATSGGGACNVNTGGAVYRYGDVSQGAAFPCRCEGGSCHPENGTCLEGSQCKRTQPHAYRWHGDGCRIGNLAFNKSAYQLRQWEDHVPGLAVDGNTTPEGVNCSHPAGGGGAAWWFVDLGELYEILRVIIYNTNISWYNRMRKFVIVVGNSTNMTENAICAEYSGKVPRGGQADLRCDSPLYGRYAGFLSRRTDSDKEAVVICEFVAMGRSIVDCSLCPDCCDDYNGCRRCPNGTRLPDCVRECSGNHDYGENCESRCSDHCAESAGRVCEAYNGTCLWGCNITDFHNGDWWVGDTCDVIVRPLTSKTMSNLSTSSTATTVTVQWTEEAKIPPVIATYYGYFIHIVCENVTDWNKTIQVPLKSGRFQMVTIPEVEPDTVYWLTISTFRQYVNGTVYEMDHGTNTSKPAPSGGVRIRASSMAIQPITIPSTMALTGIAVASVLILAIVGSLIGLGICKRRKRTDRIPPPHRDAVGADPQVQNEADMAECEADGYQSLAAADPQGPASYSQLLGRQETEDSYAEIGDLSTGAGGVNEYDYVTRKMADCCKEDVIYQIV